MRGRSRSAIHGIGLRVIRAVCAAILLMAPACTAPHTGQVAKRWELVGPFRAFARSAKSEEPRPQPSVPNSSDTDQAADPPSGPGAGVTTQPASQPATSQPSEDEDWFSLTPVDSESSIEEVDPFGEGESPVYHDAPGGHRLFAPAEERSDKFWYLDLGFRMGITKLHATKQQLDRRLDLPQKIDVVGIFESPQTPLDRKTDFALTTAYIGLGRRETEWLTWNFYFGSGVGGDRDHQRWLNLNQEVNFNYALYYTGLTVDIYPWGLSQRGQYINLKEHFRASRPYMLTGMEIGYLRAKGWGHFAIAPVTIYADEQKIRDWLFSWLVGFGWEFPINDRWVYNMQIHYTFHAYRPEEYNGWNLTYAIRYEF